MSLGVFLRQLVGGEQNEICSRVMVATDFLKGIIRRVGVEPKEEGNDVIIFIIVLTTGLGRRLSGADLRD